MSLSQYLIAFPSREATSYHSPDSTVNTKTATLKFIDAGIPRTFSFSPLLFLHLISCLYPSFINHDRATIVSAEFITNISVHPQMLHI